MKNKLTVGRIVVMIILLACSGCAAKARPVATPVSTPLGGGIQLANPASVYCKEQGYISEIRTAADGSQYGVCIFPDGTECEEWAFFRGECGPRAGAVTATLTPVSPPQAVAGARVSIPEIRLSFEMPEGWQREGQEWTWVPASSSASAEQRLGLNWQNIAPGQEPESILPKSAVTMGRTEGPELRWGAAATYWLQVMTPGEQGLVQAVEMHVLVRGQTKWYDFYARGRDEEELSALEPALQHMLTTVTLAE